MRYFIILFFIIALPACGQKNASVTTSKFYCTPCNSHCDTLVHNAPGKCSHCDMPLVSRTDEEMKKVMAAIKKGKLKVAIFLYEGVELLDFAGPGEVFSASGCETFTVAATLDPIKSQGFVHITPKFSIDNCPQPDIIVLPGGSTGASVKDEKVIAWLKSAVPGTIVSMSVCTGAALFAKAGFLENKTATTFHNFIDKLQEMAPNTKVLRDTRFVDNGTIITTAGVSAGIDGALHVISRIMGVEIARQVALYMEYDKWKEDEGLIVSAH